VVENDQLLGQASEARLERLEALVAKGLANDNTARAALLGTEKKSAFKLSDMFIEYEAMTKDEVRDLSPDQCRVGRSVVPCLSPIGRRPGIVPCSELDREHRRP
jgi:hypothetical protein